MNSGDKKDHSSKELSLAPMDKTANPSRCRMSEALPSSCGEPYAVPLQVELVDAVLLRFDQKKPSIDYVLSSGEHYISSFPDEESALKAWGVVGEEFGVGSDFMGYDDAFVRIAHLAEIKKCSAEEMPCLHFIFSKESGADFKLGYPDEKSRDAELANFEKQLKAFQEKLATAPLSPTKQ